MLNVVLSLLLISFLSFSQDNDSKCSWRKLYGKSYWDSRSPKDKPVSRVRLALHTDERYIELYHKKNKTAGEKLERKLLERGYNSRHANLLGLKQDGKLSTEELKTELSIFEITRGGDGGEEAAKLYKRYKKLNPVDRARLRALVSSGGSMRAAYLAGQKNRALLNNPADVVEYEALIKSKGDRRYAEMKRLQSSGEKISPCDYEEIAYIESQFAPATTQEASLILPQEPGENSL